MKDATIHTHVDNNQEALTKRDHNPDDVGSLENGNGKTMPSEFLSDGTDTKLYDTEKKRHTSVRDPSWFPDGVLRAWSVVGASFLLVFPTFGGSRQNKC
jgi:hypothetical protein